MHRQFRASDLLLPRPIASIVIAPEDRPYAIVQCSPPRIRLLSYCVPTHQLSGHLSLSAGALSWSASTVSTLSKDHRRSEMLIHRKPLLSAGFGKHPYLRESGPFRVLTAAAGVPAGTEKRSVPRLIDYLRCTYNHRRLVCSHPAPGMDRSLYGVGSADCRLLNASLNIFHCF